MFLFLRLNKSGDCSHGFFFNKRQKKQKLVSFRRSAKNKILSFNPEMFEMEAKVRNRSESSKTEAKVRNRSKSRIRSKSSKAFWLRFLQRQLLVDEVQLQDLVSLELKRGQSL
jgi:hypothetical protein